MWRRRRHQPVMTSVITTMMAEAVEAEVLTTIPHHNQHHPQRAIHLPLIFPENLPPTPHLLELDQIRPE